MGKCLKPHTRCFPAMAHLKPLLPSFSSTSIYLCGCRGGSHRLGHFLSVCLPKHCKQASQTNMFSLDLVWLQRRGEERACRNTGILTSSCILRGKQTQTAICCSAWLTEYYHTRTQAHTCTSVHSILLTSQSKVSREYKFERI